jgi:uncharacterized membrane protein (UPF0127 family)
MGSWSFNLWKFILILFCIGAFVVSVIGFSFKDFFANTLQETQSFIESDFGISYSFNEEEGSRIALYETIEINGMELKYETVDDEAGIQQGLSDRVSMADDEGLLFKMPTEDIHAFWMYRMNFPIDMIWIRDGEIVEIAANMPPPSETGGIPKTHTPIETADMILELTAGGARRYGLRVGDKVDF